MATFIILATNLKRSLAKMHLAVWVQSISTTRMHHSTQEQSLLQSAQNRAKLDFILTGIWSLPTTNLSCHFSGAILNQEGWSFKSDMLMLSAPFPLPFTSFFLAVTCRRTDCAVGGCVSSRHQPDNICHVILRYSKEQKLVPMLPCVP